LGPPRYKEILEKGEPWTDERFPPANSSFVWKDKSNGDNIGVVNSVIWLRL